MPDTLDTDRDQLAQETAEYIAHTLIPRHDERHANSAVTTVSYVDDKRPPRDVPTIKAALLEGTYWLSWCDDRVLTAMRELHGT